MKDLELFPLLIKRCSDDDDEDVRGVISKVFEFATSSRNFNLIEYLVSEGCLKLILSVLKEENSNVTIKLSALATVDNILNAWQIARETKTSFSRTSETLEIKQVLTLLKTENNEYLVDKAEEFLQYF